METKESFHITVNNTCNNNCVFCLETDDVKTLPVPSLDEVGLILGKAREKTDSVLFTGSEPTMNKSLAAMIRLAKELAYREIRLVTNGRLLCYFDYARELLEAGLTGVIVSLHGSKKSIHDALSRTLGSFSEVIQACRNLSILKSRYRFR